MDSPDFPSGKSPRSLQGPRPTPLRVHKDSHKIRKPPVAPASHHHHQQPPPQQHRPPVIIYTVSPKVIHTTTNEFMNLVQRLTGPSAPSPVGQSSSAFQDDGGAVSPAARFASIERATKSPDGRRPPQAAEFTAVEGVDGLEMSCFPGILSPAPAALPPIPPNFFSPVANDFFQDLSPALHNNNNYYYNYNNNYNNRSYNYMEGNPFITSPTNLLSSHIISPTTPNLDLFSSLFDL